MDKKPGQFGLWNSPMSAEMLAGELGLSDVQWAGDGETLVWLERRDGCGVLMVRRPGQPPRRINDKRSVKGCVGYGGGEFRVQGDTVFFVAGDGRIYRADLDRGLPRAITPEWGSAASPVVSPDGQWVAYVHHQDDTDRIALVDAQGRGWPQIVSEGGDFYMQPSWHPEGNRLAWVRWDQPNMPWNGTFLETAPLRRQDGMIVAGEVEVVAGGKAVACLQPEYSPDGSSLAYLTDESGDWQLVVRHEDTGQVSTLSKEGRQYGGPAWVQGLRYYGWSSDGESLFAVSSHQGVMRVERIGVDGAIGDIESFEEYTAIRQLSVSSTGHLAAICEASSIPPRVVSASEDKGAQVERFASSERLSQEQLSKVRPVSWPVDDGGPVETAHGLYYPPTSTQFEGSGAPPALVMIHGGPTSQRTARWEPRNQFFATRGWAVIDVNYRGSTGYGRQYMEALFGRWGEVDVEDALGAARFLVDQGLADAEKLVIMGGSAGGYTVLQALVNHPGTFKAGVCLYGVSDLFALQMGTHKFEAHYNDTLVGSLPEAASKFRERSPIFRVDAIEDAVALYHGAKDKVVPPDQAETIAASLQRRGVPHLHHVYEEEGHGWRREETVIHFHESVLQFLTRHVLFS